MEFSVYVGMYKRITYRSPETVSPNDKSPENLPEKRNPRKTNAPNDEFPEVEKQLFGKHYSIVWFEKQVLTRLFQANVKSCTTPEPSGRNNDWLGYSSLSVLSGPIPASPQNLWIICFKHFRNIQEFTIVYCISYDFK